MPLAVLHKIFANLSAFSFVGGNENMSSSSSIEYGLFLFFGGILNNAFWLSSINVLKKIKLFYLSNNLIFYSSKSFEVFFAT